MSRPAWPPRVTVVEVGPRDGLQNEASTIPIDARIRFVNELAAAGLPVVEAAAFVSPRWVPQMAGAEAVAAGITRRKGTIYRALVPNLKGLDAARRSAFTEIAIFAAASETFSQQNINRSIADSLAVYAEVCRGALDAGLRVRAYLSTAFGCPYEGLVPAARVAELSERLLGMGAFEVAVSDTIGIAHPGQVLDLLDVVAQRLPLARVALHFHDTRGMAIANVWAALSAGIATFDASAGGLGGCPYAPGAAGNLATEDLIYLLDGLGIAHGVSLDGVVAASRALAAHLDHPLPSRVYQAVQSSRR